MGEKITIHFHEFDNNVKNFSQVQFRQAQLQLTNFNPTAVEAELGSYTFIL